MLACTVRYVAQGRELHARDGQHGCSGWQWFDDPKLPGEIHVTVTLKPVPVGTELNIVQEDIPDMIPPEACYLGWQESLRNLAKLVEPEINQ
jgi:hypothetical protein